MKMTREEMETVILGNAACREWNVMTADPRIIRKMKRQGYEPNPNRTDPAGYHSFTVPFTRISIRRKQAPKSSEQNPIGPLKGLFGRKPPVKTPDKTNQSVE